MARIRRIRVRHYTRSSRAERILDEQRLRAGVQNKVFVENARRRLLSPRDAEERYKLSPGKGNAVIEFDVDLNELQYQPNPIIRREELYLEGDVDLKNRNPTRVR